MRQFHSNASRKDILAWYKKNHSNMYLALENKPMPPSAYIGRLRSNGFVPMSNRTVAATVLAKGQYAPGLRITVMCRAKGSERPVLVSISHSPSEGWLVKRLSREFFLKWRMGLIKSVAREKQYNMR